MLSTPDTLATVKRNNLLKFTLILNGGRQPIRLEDIPLDAIEASNEEYASSTMVAYAPPNKNCYLDRIAVLLFFLET